ncbi:MAG: guanylate kinase [Alphaproteobacteria bacterium]
MTAIARRGLMLVLSSPSGAGKTTLAHALLERDSGIVMSVSATTRPKRSTEVEGRDYYFIGEARFDEMVHTNEFLEYAAVFGYRYGTPKRAVDEALSKGRDVLFDIDWQGTQQLAQRAKDDLVRVFVLPPSRAELERRLRERAEDSEDIVKRRMARANDEISHWAEYDYVIVNDDLALAGREIDHILAAERVKRVRQTGLIDLVKRLMV